MPFNIKNILYNHGYSINDKSKNIYLVLYDSIKKAIQYKSLIHGIKLPPSRILSKDLGVSRSTVIKAYELLVLEKYVSVIQGSGSFVNKIIAQKETKSKEQEKRNLPKLSKIGKAFKSHVLVTNNNEIKGIPFRPGMPPLDIFPILQWQKLSNIYWGSIKSSELSYYSPTGLPSLKESLIQYLKIYRGITCHANQIVVTTGSLHSLSLIGSVLIDRNDEVVVENPTYPYAVNLFKSLRAKICSTTIDAEGICINEVVCNKPKLVYTTPSNQHPTGVKMSKNRRIELLKWATKNNAFIVEDDYDHEFSNWENPITAIYNLDEHSRVIYLGSFNKILHPSIRLGYMIIPEYLLDSISGLLQQSSRFVSPSIQKTLSLFIEKDYLNRHLRNIIQVSSERKEVFLKALSENFENELTINSNNKGLNVIAELKEGVDDEKLSNYLNETGVTTYAYSNYFHQGDKKNGLVMGYCSVNNALIQENITKMAASYYEFIELQKR